MSELAITARSKAREKVERLTRSSTGKVDASGWTEPKGEDANVQTGPRPVSRRQFRRGGKVHGGRFAHAGRKPRASGGMTASEYLNRNVKEANESREGPKHVGGMKKGGRAHRDSGGRLPADISGIRVGNKGPSSRPAQHLAQSAMRMTSKHGADPYDSQPAQAANYGKLWNLKGGKPSRKSGGRIHGASCSCAKCSGGRVGKARGGRSEYDANRSMRPASMSDEAIRKEGQQRILSGTNRSSSRSSELTHEALRRAGKLKSENPGPFGMASGGSVSYGGSRPEGGRIARKHGGRSKKAMNVNIIIAPSGGAPKPAMPPPGMMPPPPGAGPGLHQGMPPPPPPMPPGGAPPPMGPSPMMRKRGGRTYPIENGAGGGLGRLEKARAYGP